MSEEIPDKLLEDASPPKTSAGWEELRLLPSSTAASEKLP